MNDLATGRTITLHPGDVAIAERGQTLETLLGSCVAIALTDRHQTVGVLCHIVHARPAPESKSGDAAYADVALRVMVSLLQSRGLAASMCDAYVHGGGNMFPKIVPGGGVGGSNARWALEALAALGATVRHVDIGGIAGRRLRWTIGAGAPQVEAVLP